jgi:hypothetical protein
MPIFEFWDFGWIMAIKPMERWGTQLVSMGFFNIAIKFLIDRVYHYAIYCNFGTLARLESRSQAQMTNDHGSQAQNNPCAKTFTISLYMSNSDSRNSSYARKDGFLLIRVLVKARFPDSKAMDPKFHIWNMESIGFTCIIFFSYC